jgi:hypothetical protein
VDCLKNNFKIYIKITITEKGTLEELMRVHFPGSKTILEPSGGWDGLELEFPKWRGSREDREVPKGSSVITN